MQAKKSLGQNFLMHARIAERIAEVATLPAHATVLEIGPGKGMLTRALLARAKKVIAIETDKDLFGKLQIDFAPEIANGRLVLSYDDIRNYPLIPAIAGIMDYHVVANIPYYLTGEIFRMFLEAENQPLSMTLLVQKEVAERIVARSGKESILSLSVKAFGIPKKEFGVPRGAFMPAPNVDSAVLTIRGISRTHFDTKAQENKFFALIKAGFAHKRKFVRTNLVTAGFRAEGVGEKARAEDLSLETWLTLCRG